MSDANDQKRKLLQLVHDAIQQDGELRAKYQVGEKFRFIRDRLQTLLALVEEHISIAKTVEDSKNLRAAEDEMLVYVYIFNAQGAVFSSWQKMVNPTVFYEYSVNRPIYAEKNHAEAIIRSKSNTIQHGYLTVIVKKTALLPNVPGESLEDQLHHATIRIKEGSLHVKNLVGLTHNNIDYILNADGQLVAHVPKIH